MMSGSVKRTGARAGMIVDNWVSAWVGRWARGRVNRSTDGWAEQGSWGGLLDGWIGWLFQMCSLLGSCNNIGAWLVPGQA